MIRFEDWNIYPSGDIIARQYDNKTRVLSVIGDIPSGWTWVMIVQVGDRMDYLPLSPIEGGVGIELTASHLSIAGHYDLQLRGTRGEEVRHTNITSVNIPESLAGDARWPIVPSEFSDLERRVNEKAAQVEGYSTHPPIIGENGNWLLWDGKGYADSGYPAKDETDKTLSVPGRPADSAVTGEALNFRSQGMCTEVKINSGGWKRIAVLLRGNTGTADIMLGGSKESGFQTQNLLIGYSGYGVYPSARTFGRTSLGRVYDLRGKPALWQLSNQRFGESDITSGPEHTHYIDKVRLVYPVSYDEIPEEHDTDGIKDAYSGPINMCLDVHVVRGDGSVDWTLASPISLECNIAGHAVNTGNQYFSYNESTTAAEDIPRLVDDQGRLLTYNAVKKNGVVTLYEVVGDAYEFALSPRSGISVDEPSRFAELMFGNLYRKREISCDLGSRSACAEALAEARLGSTRMRKLSVNAGLVKYIQVLHENMAIDAAPRDWTYPKDEPILHLRRYPNGVYALKDADDNFGTVNLTDRTLAHQIYSYNQLAPVYPIILKAGVTYQIRDCRMKYVPLSTYQSWDGTSALTETTLFAVSTAGDPYGDLPAGTAFTNEITPTEDLVVTTISIMISGVQTNRCYYPQIARADIGVKEVPQSATRPMDIDTGLVPYSPNALAVDIVNESRTALIFDFHTRKVTDAEGNDHTAEYINSGVWGVDASYAKEIYAVNTDGIAHVDVVLEVAEDFAKMFTELDVDLETLAANLAGLQREVNGIPVVNVAVGSYPGNDLYGKDTYHNQITFPFQPKMVIVKRQLKEIFGESTGTVKYIGVYEQHMIAFYGEPATVTGRYIGETGIAYCSNLNWDGKTLSWYGDSPHRQLNLAGCRYNYIAIG